MGGIGWNNSLEGSGSRSGCETGWSGKEERGSMLVTHWAVGWTQGLISKRMLSGGGGR